MRTFLRAMADVKRGTETQLEMAMSTLDLSEINVLVRREKRKDLAWMLLEVIDHTRVVDFRKLPSAKDGAPYIFHRYNRGAVTIARQADGRWLFSAETLHKLPTILDELGSSTRAFEADAERGYLPVSLRLRAAMPTFLKASLGWLEYWQWLGLLAVLLVGVFADRTASRLLQACVVWGRRRATGFYRLLSEDLLRPLGLMLMAALWSLGSKLLGLPEDVLLVVLVAAEFLAGLSGIWAAYRLVDLVGAYWKEKAADTASRLDDMLVPLFVKVSKLGVTLLGFLFIATNLNINITGLMAGLGLGGLAFALAAKDVVENLFGSITVLTDRPFHVGDWVRIGDVEGNVESIGFRSTRIRTFYNSRVTVPNSRLITAEVDNLGARTYRRFKCMLSLTYDTPPERIEAFCEGIRELVRIHPHTRKDYYHVYFNAYAASSLDILLYIFFETPDWSAELQQRHRFLLDILRLSKRLQVDFAFPTQTVHWQKGGKDAGLPAVELRSDMDPEAVLELGRQEAEVITKQFSPSSPAQ